MFSYCVCGHLIPFPLNSACLRGRASYLISALPHQSRRWAGLNSAQNTSCWRPQEAPDPDLGLTREALRSSTGLSWVTHPQEVCKIHVTVSEMGRETVYNQAHFNIKWVYCSIISALLFARYCITGKKAKQVAEKKIFVCVLDRLSGFASRGREVELCFLVNLHSPLMYC